MSNCLRTLCAIAALLIAGCAHNEDAHVFAQGDTSSGTSAKTPLVVRWTADDRGRAYGIVAKALDAPVFADAGLVVLGSDGATIFARNATKPFVPASSLKLLIAATALDAFGPSQRLETSFVVNEPPDQDGIVQGPLWLIGGGDPVLKSDDLRGGVGMLSRLGIRRIAGGLIVDASAFSGPGQNPDWDPSDLSYDYASGTSAISLDWDVAEFHVTPETPGDAARVEVRPANQNVSYTGSITTASAGSDSDVSIVRDPPTGEAAGDRNVFALSGHIADGEAQSFYKPVLNIPSYVGGAVAAMLAERGIELDGGVQLGSAPFAAEPLWVHRSHPLSDLVHDMLVYSDNHVAEQLLQLVGFERYRTGTIAGGLRAERSYLEAADIPTTGMHVVDGSGLSPHDRVPPLALARVLNAALQGRNGDVFLRDLPLVGREGTVRRHRLTVGLGYVRAKSGHIDQVSALAGTVQSRHHGRLVFAFIVNGPYADADAVDEGTDHALDALAAL